MNRELINKHRPEFDWLLKDPCRTIMYKTSVSTWQEWGLAIFKKRQTGLPAKIIVINDPHVDLRMAEADGKEIRFRVLELGLFKDFHTIGKFGNGCGPLNTVSDVVDAYADRGLRLEMEIVPSPKWPDYASEKHPVRCIGKGGKAYSVIAKCNGGYRAMECSITGDDVKELRPILASELHPFQRDDCYTLEDLVMLQLEWIEHQTNAPSFIEWLKSKAKK